MRVLYFSGGAVMKGVPFTYPCWMYVYPFIGFLCLSCLHTAVDSAIVPPPWSNPMSNPCASMPGGWQLLYWPPLKKCFKIFSVCYHCHHTIYDKYFSNNTHTNLNDLNVCLDRIPMPRHNGTQPDGQQQL